MQELNEALENGKKVYWKTDKYPVKKFVKGRFHQWRIVNKNQEDKNNFNKNVIVFYHANHMLGKISDYYYNEE